MKTIPSVTDYQSYTRSTTINNFFPFVKKITVFKSRNRFIKS